MRRWLTFSNVLSVVALFAAIGLGTAFALSRNSVGSKAIKPRAVRASDLARGAVNTKKVRNGSLRMEDFAANQLPSGGGPVISVQDGSSTNLPVAATVVLTSPAVSVGGGGTYVATATGLLEPNTGGGEPECWLTVNGATAITHPFAAARIENVSGAPSTIAIARSLSLAAGDTLTLVCDSNAAANAVAIDEKSIVAFRTGG